MSQTVEPILEEDKIYAKIVELYETKPNFILHIFRSFFPNLKVKRVENFRSQNLYNRRCCISDQRLVDLYNASKIISRKDNVPADLVLAQISDLRTMIQQIESSLNENGGTYRIALVGQNTDKMLCLPAYNQLCLFIKNKFEEGDKYFKSTVYREFCSCYKEEINKRFDTSVKYFKCSSTTQLQFEEFVHERIIPGIDINYESIWETVSGRDYYPKHRNQDHSSQNNKSYEQRQRSQGQRNSSSKRSSYRK